MAFHGHTKIELHNVKTGEDKVIEKHNIFTNYLHDVMQVIPTPNMMNWMNCGKGSYRYGSVQWDDQDNTNGGYPSIVDILCGGIFCLENEREENPDNYFLTSDDVITARGANIANGTDDVKLGTYNRPLEKKTDTSKTMVWDFAQNQGNGTISTIGLTNIGMALCGLGGTPSNMTHTSINPFGDVCLAKNFVATLSGGYDDDYPTTEQAYPEPIYCSLKNNMFVSFLGVTSKVLELRYYDLNCSVLNPMSSGGVYAQSESTLVKKFGVNYSSNRIYRYSTTKRVKLDLSSYFSNFTYMTYSVTNDGIMYVNFNNTYQWRPNTTITFVKIDLINQKILGTCSVTNTSGIDLCTNENSSFDIDSTHSVDSSYFCKILDGYMLFPSYRGDPSRLFAINIDNSTDVKEILKEDGSPFRHEKHMCYFADGVLSSEKDNTSSPAYIINVKKGIAYRVRTGKFKEEYFIEGTTMSQYRYIHSLPSDSDIINMWFFSTGGKYVKYPGALIVATYKQDVLSTINVLDEPVTKTADMTMRITYTISLEEDEE